MKSRVRLPLSWLVAVALLISLAGVGRVVLAWQMPPYGGRAEHVTDLQQRRERAMAALGPETVLVLWSAPPRVYSTDTNYEYRQESNLLYLTGLAEENLILVLVPGSPGPREFLFVPASNPFRELWTGHIPTAEEARAATGVAQVFAQRGMEAFDAFIQGLLARRGQMPVTDAGKAGAAAALSGDRLRIALLDATAGAGAAAPNNDATRQMSWLRRVQQQDGAPAITATDASRTLLELRQIKTPYEQRVLRRSVEISADAHLQGMKTARPGRWEYEVEAAIEHTFLVNGALSWGYPSIVGSGPNATTLHYVRSTRQMQAGDLVLVDAAGNFQGLTGDITRTYPVSGRFSRDQRALYELVLAAEIAGIAAARPGGTVEVITKAVRATLGAGLLRLGLVTDPAAASGDSNQIGLWFPHSPVHGIGVDVHDPLGRLDPGAAFVIEPGLYIRPDTLDRLGQDPAQAEFVRTVRPAVERYRNLGIRVEDSFLMTATGPDNLSSKAPSRVSEIEQVVGSGR